MSASGLSRPPHTRCCHQRCLDLTCHPLTHTYRTHTDLHAHTHMHVRIHTHAHMYTHTRTHTYTRTHARTHTYTHANSGYNRPCLHRFYGQGDCPLTDGLTRVLTHSLTHTITHSLTHTITHSLTHTITSPCSKAPREQILSNKLWITSLPRSRNICPYHNPVIPFISQSCHPIHITILSPRSYHNLVNYAKMLSPNTRRCHCRSTWRHRRNPLRSTCVYGV